MVRLVSIMFKFYRADDNGVGVEVRSLAYFYVFQLIASWNVSPDIGRLQVMCNHTIQRVTDTA